MKPCAQCPWMVDPKQQDAAFTDEVRDAALKGQWFCCHVNMGTCHGAEAWANAKRKQLEPVAA